MFNVPEFTNGDLTGNPEVDGLFWTGYYAGTNVITYSFQYDDGPLDVPTGAFSADQEEVVLQVLADISRVTGITFEVDDSNPMVTITDADLSSLNAVGYAFAPSGGGSTVYLDRYNYHFVSQEIMHALGLVGPNETGAFVSDTYPIEFQSSIWTSLLTEGHYSHEHGDYGRLWEAPTGLLALDIEALQAVYGVNEEATAGNDRYVFDTSEFYLEGLYDSGGNDQIVIVDEARLGVELDLNPRGGFHLGQTVTYADDDVERYTVHTTADTIIERAKLAGGDDMVTGNDANNVVSAGDGDDTVYGGSGNDTVWAGAGDTGNDYFNGGSGDDVMGGGDGNDTLIGGDGFDLMYGSSGDDVVHAASEGDTSSTANDVLWAGTGDDTVYGSDGNNTIGARDGDDLVFSFGGDDTVYMAKGDDVADTGTGNDRVFGGQGNDDINSGEGDDVVYGGAGDDTLNAGAGNDVIYSGGGNDTITTGLGSDTIHIKADDGDNTVTDFDADLDLLGLETAGFETLADVRAASSQEGDTLIIELGSGSISLVGITIDDLSLDNLIF